MPTPQLAKAPLQKPNLAPLVQELHDLRKKIAAYKPDISREAALCTLLRATANDEPAGKEIRIEGTKSFLLLGARTNQTIPNVLKLFKLITMKAFLGVVTCTAKALKENEVDPAIVAQIMETTQTGYRPLDTFEK